LTGLLNRRAFVETATLELARAERYQRSLSLAYLDIDDFKKVNDEAATTTATAAGGGRADAEAQPARLRCRRRYGGDEFVLLLPRLSTRPRNWSWKSS